MRISLGSIVLFRFRDGRDFPAIVTKIDVPEPGAAAQPDRPDVNLSVFTDGMVGASNAGVQQHKSVPYSGTPSTGTWRWPE